MQSKRQGTHRRSTSVAKTKAFLQRALHDPVEKLEARVLFTIATAGWFEASQLAGSNWKVRQTDDNSSAFVDYALNVFGPATFNGKASTELDTTFANTSGLDAKTYHGNDSTGDYVSYGSDTTTVSNGTAHQVEIDTPYSMDIPAELTAGVKQSFEYSFKTTLTNSNGTTVTTGTRTQEFTLESETPTTITVPAGTYEAYAVDETDTETIGGSTSTPTTTTTWYTPGAVAVKADLTSTTLELLDFNGGARHLAFTGQPSTTAKGKAIKPAVQVSVEDSSDTVDAEATGQVMLTLTNASRLTTSTGKLGGTTSATLVGGVATFTNLTVSADGTYQLQATDTNNDSTGSSNKFKVGAGLQLSITSKAPHGTKGVRAGETIFYSFVVTPAQAVQRQSLVITVPPKFVASNITAGGVYSASANTITWSKATVRGATFDLKVPNVKALAAIKAVDVAGDDNVVYADSSTDEATATNHVKLATAYEVDGTVNDAIFRPGVVGKVVVNSPLAHVTAQLFDDQGAIIDSVVTSSDGVFKLTAQAPGTYSVHFSAQAEMYSSIDNKERGARFYAAKSAVIEQSQEEPTDMGQLVMPKNFLSSSATILDAMNNYNVSGAQNLSSLNIDMFKFDTTGAESALLGLMGTELHPATMFKAASLKANKGYDQWVAAIRMMAGLYEINQRFVDALKLSDTTGKVVGVILSALVAAGTDKFVRDANQSSFDSAKISWESSIPQQQLKGSEEALYTIARTLTFTTMGDTCSELANQIIAGINKIAPFKLGGSDKSGVIAAMFTCLRNAADLATNSKFISDASFEAAFSLVRLNLDALLLHLTAGISLRDDIPVTVKPFLLQAYALTAAGSAFDYVSGGQVQFPTMQEAINNCVNNRANYESKTDTNEVLSSLDTFDSKAHGRAAYEGLALQAFNSTSSNFKAADGVLFQLRNKVAAAAEGATWSQAPIQAALKSIQGPSFQSLAGDTLAKPAVAGVASKVASTAGYLAMISGIAGAFEQNLSATFVPALVQTGSTGSDVITGSIHKATAAKTVVAATTTAAPNVTVHPDTTATEADALVADLNQLSKWVKAKSTARIVPVYQKILTDQKALFDNDLDLLDGRADALLAKFSTKQVTADSTFHADLAKAAQALFLTFQQLDAWGVNTATGSAGDVTSQIADAVTMLNALNTAASPLRTAVAHFSVPATLQVDQSAVPADAPVNSTQDLTFTITNLGSVATAAGSAYFTNSDGSLVLQSPSQQSLPAIPAGGSTTVSWQVNVLAQSNGSTAAVYQVQAVAGQVIGGVTDQISVTG